MSSLTTTQRFRDAAYSYLKDSRFSDLSITCDGHTFSVHRCFVCAHSDFFQRCCEGGFAESQSHTIELKEDPLEAVTRMIDFFYTFDYDDKLTAGECKSNPLSRQISGPQQLNAWVYTLADKYGIPDLKDRSLEKFKNAAAANAFMPHEMTGVIWVVYKQLPLLETDRALHNVLTDEFIRRLDCMGDDRSKILDLICPSVPKFLVDLSVRLSDRIISTNFCAGCKKKWKACTRA